VREATENLMVVDFGSQLPIRATNLVERRRTTKVLETREGSEDAKGTVPSLRRSVAGLAPWRPGLNPRRVHMGFMLDGVALRHVFLEASLSFHHCSILIRSPPTVHNLSN
jgi:hypothetical protein